CPASCGSTRAAGRAPSRRWPGGRGAPQATRPPPPSLPPWGAGCVSTPPVARAMAPAPARGPPGAAFGWAPAPADRRAAPRGAGAVLAGDLARISFPEIVTLVVQSRASGVLRVATASGTRRVWFSEGEVRGAASERVGERISEILVRVGSVKRDDMESLCAEA